MTNYDWNASWGAVRPAGASWLLAALAVVHFGCEDGGPGAGPGSGGAVDGDAAAAQPIDGPEGGDALGAVPDGGGEGAPGGDGSGWADADASGPGGSDAGGGTDGGGPDGGPDGGPGRGPDGGGVVPGCDPPAGTPTWNDQIGSVLVSKCGLCHGDPPVFGAPLPLMTYGDLTAITPSGAPAFERAAARIADGSMPPPSQPQLTAAEREAVAAWAEGCAPEGDGEFVPPRPGGGGEELPPPPEGAEIVEVRAAGYTVPLVNDEYMCFPIKLALDGPKHIVRFGVEVDKAPVVHHIVLYSLPKNANVSAPFKCTGTPTQAQFMYGWAPGGGDLQFPVDFGFPVEDGDVVALQMHYNNGAKLEGMHDDSAVLLYLTDPQPNEMGMVATGKNGFSIPPFAETTISSQCRPKHDITIFASMPHMHEIGKTFDHWVERASGEVVQIAKVENWSFDDQPFYLTPVFVAKEDRMITACTFQNPHPHPVGFGSKTTDEMCYNFFYHYPPLGAMFCDELLDEDKAIAYVPGACANTNAPEDPPLATGGIKLATELDLSYGGAGPQGLWQLETLHLVLPTLNTPVGKIDTQATAFYAKGYIEADGHDLVVDVALAGDLALESGLKFPYETQVSFAGTWSLNAQGEVELQAACSTDFPFDKLRFSPDSDQMAALLDVKISGITLTFETTWSPPL